MGPHRCTDSRPVLDLQNIATQKKASLDDADVVKHCVLESKLVVADGGSARSNRHVGSLDGKITLLSILQTDEMTS